METDSCTFFTSETEEEKKDYMEAEQRRNERLDRRKRDGLLTIAK